MMRRRNRPDMWTGCGTVFDVSDAGGDRFQRIGCLPYHAAGPGEARTRL
ncbi:hypothetical protein SIAM614_24917 [Roseibium aggregatum IAM 12614]|uniref:Uncharacterized protein n=1 Tax=Roseibium aggregatum (strain ATCC 25650 / DSM 13394 / JCM 20685 / NBRC 16684 / NCIMB 2208 / IAM 12614 / B1) TaxID=384765 RepID=A0NYS0_ROSAI|nr:hypothetical protein SIAM614_24917 [Roseibium aggregatum IAM 12614]